MSEATSNSRTGNTTAGRGAAGTGSSPRERCYVQNAQQSGRYASPWSLSWRIKTLVWNVVYLLLFRPTLKPLNPWRLFLLRLFGATIRGTPFVSESAIIKYPWYLTLEDRACLAPKSEVYNLAPITLKARCVVSQYTYLCAGTHDFDDPVQPLVVGPIVVGEDVFIGAKALILPGVVIGDGSVIAAGAVLTKDTPARTIWGGNPAKLIRSRDK